MDRCLTAHLLDCTLTVSEKTIALLSQLPPARVGSASTKTSVHCVISTDGYAKAATRCRSIVSMVKPSMFHVALHRGMRLTRQKLLGSKLL